MYRPTLNPRDRIATIAAVAAIHAALAFMLLNASGVVDVVSKEDLTQLIDIAPEPPPPPVAEIATEQPAKKKEGEASAKNIESKATPVVAPEPKIPVPTPQPIVASPTPKEGTEATQGASDVVGPGTGAGGVGSGTGAGGRGNGPGGGGMGQGTRPRLVSRPLSGRDYPSGLRRSWPAGGRVMVAVRVQLDGRATDCKVNQSSGNPTIDMVTCNLVQSKLRFQPARDGNGRPYVAWYGYMQFPVNF